MFLNVRDRIQAFLDDKNVPVIQSPKWRFSKGVER